MSVYKREYSKGKSKFPVWYYCFRYRKECYRQAGFVTKAEAQLAEEQARKTIIWDNKRLTPAINSSLQDLLPGYFANRAITNAPGTAAREQYHIRPFLKEFSKTLLSKISIADIQWHIRQRKKDGISNRTINLEINLLRCIFKYGIDVGAAINNPAKEIKKLKVVREEVEIPTHEGFLRFIQAASETRYGKEITVWLWFRAYTATRERESLFVEWKDIDFEKNIIRIIPKPDNPLKNARCRNLIMVEDLRKVLLDWRREWLETFNNGTPPHDWVFFNPNQKHMRADGFRAAFRKAREKAGITFFTSKDLRHYCLSHGMMSNISKDVLRTQAGHVSTQMIEQTYGHLSQEYRAQEMKKFSFFHPNNGSKPDETLKNIQPQEQPGSPAGATEGKTGEGNGEANLL